MKENTTMNDPIDAALDAMTPEELRANARRAIVAQSWLNLSPGDRDSEHQDLANDAVEDAWSDHLEASYVAVRDAFIASGHDEEIAAANWHRRFLNIAPLDKDLCEVPTEGFSWDAWDRENLS